MREAGQFRFALESDSLAVGVSAFCPYLYVRLGDAWVLALAGGDGKSVCGELDIRAADVDPPSYDRLDREDGALVLRGEGEGWTITTRCACRDAGKGLHFRTTLETQRALDLARLRSTLWFVPNGKPLSQYARPDEVWVPHLGPDEERPSAEQMRISPMLVLEHGGVGAVVIPDSSGPRPYRNVLDYDFSDPRRDAPRISCGLIPAKIERSGSSYGIEKFAIQLPAGSSVTYGYSVWLNAGVGRGETRRSALRRLWRLHGHPRLRRLRSQPRSWSEEGEVLFSKALSSQWRSITVGGKPVGGFQECEKSSLIPLGTCRNVLQSAYGLHWWGGRLKHRAWREAAALVPKLVLTSPLRSGCFPSGFELQGLQWSGPEKDGRFASADMAWSAYWMVRWHRELGADLGLLRRAAALGEFLVMNQNPSGAIPPLFRTSDLQPVEASPAAGSTATAALFLVELVGVLRRQAFAGAARRGAEFLVKEVIPSERYFEPDLACRVAAGGDSRQHVLLHGALTIHRTAELLRKLFELSQETRLLEAGLRALDHLCAYQVSTSSGAGSVRPFGVFWVDGKTNGCRLACSAAFAETLLHYYRLTGLREYFERGAAALRASFTTSGDLTALAAAATIDRRFGSLYLDAGRGLAGALDGCSTRATRDSERQVEIRESLGRPRSIDVVVEGLPASARLRWNRRVLRTARSGETARASVLLEALGCGLLSWRTPAIQRKASSRSAKRVVAGPRDARSSRKEKR